jgi:hypothetical protein
MKPLSIPVAFLLTCSLLAKAEDPPLFDGARSSSPKLRVEWENRKCWGPDDYDVKSPPCIAPNAKGKVDDYCRKAMPAVSPNVCGKVDDYCPKTCPLLFGKLAEPWYSLGPPAGPGQGPCQSCPPKPRGWASINQAHP